jgi:outer membrane protein with beta-barrel domain
MKTMLRTFTLVVCLGLATAGARAQSTDLGLTLGGNFVSNQSFSVDKSWVIQGSLAHRFFGAGKTGLYGELPIAAAFDNAPKTVGTVVAFHYSSLFVTPGVKLKIGTPLVSPYFAVGLGFARFSGPALLGTDTNLAVSYGGGVDVNILPHVGVRGELRDYNTSLPKFGFPGSGRQHNVFLTGGVFLEF